MEITVKTTLSRVAVKTISIFYILMSTFKNKYSTRKMVHQNVASQFKIRQKQSIDEEWSITINPLKNSRPDRKYVDDIVFFQHYVYMYFSPPTCSYLPHPIQGVAHL